MSLIERAVDKLGASGTPADTPSEFGTLHTVGASRKATIEQAMSLAAGARVSPAPIPPTERDGGMPEASPLARVPEADRAHLQIDLAKLRAHGFVTPDAAHTSAGQEFRVIKRPLIANAFGRGVEPVRNGRRIMVTSAFAGEGKSFCAINLAMSIAAELDHHVLLVDADVARPSIPSQLGIQPRAGLMDWLLDGTPDLETLVSPTNVDKLSVLPAGRAHPRATELLASDAMVRLTEHLSNRYPDRLIVFDSPPLLITTEARELATHMGQIVMVVEAGRTPREAVKDALEMISNTSVVGLVLNKSRESRGQYYGYQGYGYGSH